MKVLNLEYTDWLILIWATNRGAGIKYMGLANLKLKEKHFFLN